MQRPKRTSAVVMPITLHSITEFITREFKQASLFALKHVRDDFNNDTYRFRQSSVLFRYFSLCEFVRI